MYTAGAQNGNGILSFDGSNDRLIVGVSSVFAAGNADFAIVAAYKAKSAPSSYGGFFGNYPVGNLQLMFAGTIAYITPWGVWNATTIDS